MSESMRDPAAAAKARKRGRTVLERQAEEQRMDSEKEESRRPRAARRRSQSAPRAGGRHKNGGEDARGRGRQRVNEAGRRQSEAGALQVQQRSSSLMSKKDYRRSVVVNSVAPAGGAVMSACPKRTDAQFEQGTAAGTAAHAAAVREWIKLNFSDAGSELRTIDQRDRNVMLFNDWLGQNGYEQFADWVKDSDGWSAVCRMDEELEPKAPTAESLIEYAVAALEGPVYGDYVQVAKLPAGATLVKAESGSSSDKAPRLVLVVSRDEEAAGIMYDRSVPFEANGK